MLGARPFPYLGGQLGGSSRRFFQITKVQAVTLHRILQELTPSRVGSNDDFQFLADLAEAIEGSFSNEIRSSERAGNLTDRASEYSN